METKDKIKAIRKAAGISQDELAAIINYGQSHVGMVESGQRNASPKMIKAIIAGLKVNLKWWESGEGEILSQPYKESDPTIVELDRLYERIKRELPESQRWKLIGTIKEEFEEFIRVKK